VDEEIIAGQDREFGVGSWELPDHLLCPALRGQVVRLFPSGGLSGAIRCQNGYFLGQTPKRG